MRDDLSPDLMQEYKISKAEIEQFKASSVWKVIEGELKRRLESNNELLTSAPLDDIWRTSEDGGMVLERAGIRRLQGETITIKILISYPDLMLDELKALNKEEATDVEG